MTDTKTLINALRALAIDIQSGDGVANAAIAEAADRLEELYAVTSDPKALWANWLRGTVKLPKGIGDVGALNERILYLEREIDLATTQINQLGRQAADAIEREIKAQERIKRLEEAGDAMAWWDNYRVEFSDLVAAWEKAKEAKP